MHRTLPILLAGLTVVALATGGAAFAGPAGERFWLTVLHNSDGESRLLPRQGAGGGIARFAAVTAGLRREALSAPSALAGAGEPRAVLTLYAGDSVLPGPELHASLEKGVPFYDAIAFDLIGYDALALGNHEFDLGPEVLADLIRGLSRRAPFLSANLDPAAEPALARLAAEGRIAPSAVFTRAGERIGVIGATTENLPFISHGGRVRVAPLESAVRDEVAKLTRAGVDKIVLLSHLQDLRADVALVAALDGVDIVVAGGGNQVLADPGRDPLLPGDEGRLFGPYPLIAYDAAGRAVPIVTTPGRYGYVGRLVVAFDGRGHVALVDHDASAPVPVPAAGPDAGASDPEVAARVVEPLRAALAALGERRLAESEVVLDGRPEAVRTRETNLGNLIADAVLWQAREWARERGFPRPDAALVNGGGIRVGVRLPPGPLSELDTFDIAPFADFVTLLDGVSREALKAALENAVSRLTPASAPGGSGRFAQVAGLRFAFRLSGEPRRIGPGGAVLAPGNRVQRVVLDDGTVLVAGGTVVPGPPLDLATTSFIAAGGDQYALPAANTERTAHTTRAALGRYLSGPLGGRIGADAYPASGERRIVRLD